MTTFLGKKNNAKTTITDNPLTNSALTINLASSTGSLFPATNFLGTIWDSVTYSDPGDDPAMEIVLIDSVSGDVATVNASGRGYGGTSAVQHAQNSAFRLLIMKEHMDEYETAIGTLETSMGLLTGSKPLKLVAVPWTKVLNLSAVSTTSDTDLDLTAYTDAAATHVVLKVQFDSSSTTEGSYITFRAKGATSNDEQRILLHAPQVSGFHSDYPFVVVPMDSNQIITYAINSLTSASTIQAWVIGYFTTAVS